MRIHDPGRVVLRRAIRAAIIVPLAFAFTNYVLHLGAGAMYATFATFVLLVFADFGGALPRRATAYAGASVAGLIAIAVGTVIAEQPVAATIGTFVITFSLFFVGVLRGYFAASTISVLLPFAIAVTSGPGHLDGLVVNEIGWAIGSVVATAAAIFMWPVHVKRGLKKRIATVLTATANLVRATWLADADPTPVDPDIRRRELTQAHAELREGFAGQLARPGTGTPRERAMIQLLDQLSRLRTWLMWQPHIGVSASQPDVALLTVAVECLEGCAATLGRGVPPPDPRLLDAARAEQQLAIQERAKEAIRTGRTGHVLEHLKASFQPRVTAWITEMVCMDTARTTGHVFDQPCELVTHQPFSIVGKRATQMFRDHFSYASPWFRNSIRSAAAVTLATVVVIFTGVDHGFWVVLGTVAALRFDAMGTGRSALQAILGTGGGFVVSVLLMFIFGPSNHIVYWILMPLLAFFAAYAPGAISLAAGQAGFTVFVIIFFSLAFGGGVQIGELRVMDVGIGLTVSLLMSALLWPRGVSAQVLTTVNAAVHSATEYLVAAYDRLLEGPQFELELRRLRATAAMSIDQANEAFDLSLSQPGSRTVDAAAWALLSNGASHVAASANMIVVTAERGFEPIGCPEAADVMISAAHHIKATLNNSVDALSSLETDRINVEPDSPLPPDAEPTRTALDNPLPRLGPRIDECIQSWSGSDKTTIGRRAEAVVWAASWLGNLQWIAHRVGRIHNIER